MNGIGTRMVALRDELKSWMPGLIASLIIAFAATFLSEHYGASAMLFALLLGMSVNFLSTEGPCVPGIGIAAKNVLRIGVALLGMRITLDQFSGPAGWGPLLIVVPSIVLTIGLGVLLARAAGFNRQFGILTGGAVAICGASAAMAIAATLPDHEKKEHAVIFTVIGVSTLSTLAMVFYPLIAQQLGFDDWMTGVFLGATIHDVAQVVGAGYGISTATGDTATVVKLLRVVMLLPTIFIISLAFRLKQGAAKSKAPLLPGFALGFLVLVLLNSTGFVPVIVQDAANELSRWCLVVSIAAIGMKTRLKEIAEVGLRPVAIMVAETLFLMILVIVLIAVIPGPGPAAA